MPETSLYPAHIRPLADRLWIAINKALEAQNNREYKQLNSILDAIGNSQPIKIHNFWTKTAKEFAREWEILRNQPIPYVMLIQAENTAEDTAPTTESEPEPQIEATSDSTHETPTEKPKRTYRSITIENGQNPFRAGSKNFKIFGLLQTGGFTKEQIAEQSSADLKSVGYLIWLLKFNDISVKKDAQTKTYSM